MPSDPTHNRTLASERWVAPVLLAVSVALALAIPAAANGPVGRILLLAGVLALLLAPAVAWLGPDPGDRLSPLWATWFAGYSAVVWLACLTHPLFGFLAWAGYLVLTRIFPVRLMWIGTLLTAAASAVSQVGGDLGGGTAKLGLYLGLVVANSAVAGLALWYAVGMERQNEVRKAALDAAETANAQLAATLAENRALQEQLVIGAREAGVEHERARLAREIHDTIAQGLSGIVRQLDATEGAPEPEVRRRIETARDLARDGLAEARRSVQALRPEPLEAARLPEALHTVATDWSRLHGVPAGVTTTGDAQPMHPEVDVALLRVAQEALANVGRHACAGRVGVTPPVKTNDHLVVFQPTVRC